MPAPRDFIDKATADRMHAVAARHYHWARDLRERLQARGVSPVDPLWVHAHRSALAAHDLMVHLMHLRDGNVAEGSVAPLNPPKL
ncbi:MAG TPA: hypothetical protein VF796_12310 [Humisphaera sp.]